jgi:RNA polymerase sigma factor (sigma-70 family)
LANQRRGERRGSTLADRLRAEIPSAHSQPDRNGDLSALAAAFRSLPASDREILALEGWEGLTPAQIATVLGCSRNAARIRLHRARRRLTVQLPDHPSVPRPVGANALPGEPE